MPILTRYSIGCNVFTGRSAPYTTQISYYTNAQFTLHECGALDNEFERLESQPHVLGEFWRKANSTDFGRYLSDTNRIKATQYETTDVKEVRNTPSKISELFFKAGSTVEVFPVAESTTQIMIDDSDVYMWVGEQMIKAEGKYVTRPEIIEPVVYTFLPTNFKSPKKNRKPKRR